MSIIQLTPELRRLHEESSQFRRDWRKSQREIARLEGVLSKRLEELHGTRGDQLYLREVAVAFAFVAVSADPTLRTSHTLELLRQECNRCRLPDTVEIKSGFRS